MKGAKKREKQSHVDDKSGFKQKSLFPVPRVTSARGFKKRGGVRVGTPRPTDTIGVGSEVERSLLVLVVGSA